MMRGLKTVMAVVAVLFGMAQTAMGQGSVTLVRENPAHEFGDAIPAGNYSGIDHLQDNLYALVSDKGESGEIVFVSIDIDSISGDIKDARMVFSLPTGEPNSDNEDIVYLKDQRSFYIASEQKNEARGYIIDNLSAFGTISPMGKALPFGSLEGATRRNRGMESLAYDCEDRVFWTTTECPLNTDGDVATATNGVRQRLRLMALDSDGNLSHYAYAMDKPEDVPEEGTFLTGVSAITALGDGRLLVLEREVYVPEEYLGAFTRMKIYAVDVSEEKKVDTSEPLSDGSPFVSKSLVFQWKTTLSLFGQSFANYEGMCLGPILEDGSRVLILVSDSQNQYGGVLSDWFKTIVVR